MSSAGSGGGAEYARSRYLGKSHPPAAADVEHVRCFLCERDTTGTPGIDIGQRGGIKRHLCGWDCAHLYAVLMLDAEQTADKSV